MDCFNFFIFSYKPLKLDVRAYGCATMRLDVIWFVDKVNFVIMTRNFLF